MRSGARRISGARSWHEFAYGSVTVPVNSVNAHDEGLYVRVGRAAELAAGLSAERGAITQCEMVQRADRGAVGHHCWADTHTQKNRQTQCLDFGLVSWMLFAVSFPTSTQA